MKAFLLIFFSTVICPYYVLIYTNNYFQTIYDSDKSYVYSIIVTVVYVWIAFFSLLIYYYLEDFSKVFCPRQEEKSTQKDLKKIN